MDAVQHLEREAAIVEDARLPHQRRVRGEPLDERVPVQLQHAIQLRAVREDLDLQVRKLRVHFLTDPE